MRFFGLYLMLLMITSCAGESEPGNKNQKKLISTDKTTLKKSAFIETSVPEVMKMSYKKLIQSKSSESAVESLNRYEKLLQILVNTVDDFEDSLSLYSIEYSQKDKSIITKNILSTEERFNINLPESYKTFMLDKGPFSFGEDNRDSYFYTPNLNTLVDEIINTDYYKNKDAIKKDYGEDGLKRMEQLICFKKSDDYAFLCFDKTSYNPKTKEMNMYFNDQDDWLGYKIEQPSFDKYIVAKVNERIEQLIGEIDFQEN